MASQTKKRMGECVSVGWRNTARKKRGRNGEIEKRSRYKERKSVTEKDIESVKRGKEKEIKWNM